MATILSSPCQAAKLPAANEVISKLTHVDITVQPSTSAAPHSRDGGAEPAEAASPDTNRLPGNECSAAALRYLLAWFSIVPAALGLSLPLTQLAMDING